nr:helix-turn-helix domain-containing protein [uncultured Porphyromonas sp.]
MKEEKGEREEPLQAMEPKKRSEKQRAGDRMREKILQVARAEFLEYGFRDASLRRIAVKTSISVSNIYNHYKSKDDLFRAVLHPYWNLLLRCFESIIARRVWSCM